MYNYIIFVGAHLAAVGLLVIVELIPNPKFALFEFRNYKNSINHY